MPRPTTGLSYLTLMLVVLGALVFTIFVTAPQWVKFREARQEHASEIARREERRQFLASIGARLQELEAYEGDVLALSVALPEQIRPADLLAQLQAIGGRSGVRVETIGEPKRSQGAATPATVVSTDPDAPGAPAGTATTSAPTTGTLQQWETTLTVNGTYPQIRAFVRDLESALVLSDVQFLKLKGVASAAEGAAVGTPVDLLKAELHLRTYVQPEPER